MTPSEASMKLAYECARGNLLHFCSNRCSSIGDDPRFDCHCIRSFATDIALLLDRVRAEALEEAAGVFERKSYDYATCAAFAKDISERQNFKNAQAANLDVVDEIRALIPKKDS